MPHYAVAALTAWATVFERTSDRIRARFEPRFPHVHPHRLRHSFSMHTLEYLVTGYYRQAAKLVRDTDRELKQLDRKAAKASDEAKAQIRSDMKELRAKRAEAAKKLDEMGKASAGAWENAKNGFADAYKDLHQAYARAVEKLK